MHKHLNIKLENLCHTKKYLGWVLPTYHYGLRVRRHFFLFWYISGHCETYTACCIAFNQIYFYIYIFISHTDNSCILCLFCKVKIQNNCQILPKKGKTGVVLIVFKDVLRAILFPFLTSILYCSHFLLFALHESGTRRLLYVF